MAAVSVINGTLAANTAGPWVAIPEARLYVIQASQSSGNQFMVEMSIDGVSALNVSINTSVVGEPRVIKVVDLPALWVRARNPSAASATGKIDLSAV